MSDPTPIEKLTENQQLFTVIPDAYAIISKGGIQRQVPVYARGDAIYAGHAGGFISLNASGSTSVPGVRLLSLVAPMLVAKTDGVGRLQVESLITPPPRIETAQAGGRPNGRRRLAAPSTQS